MKQNWGRWPKLFKNTEGDTKPQKELLWVDKHLEHEDNLIKWRNDNEQKQRFDDYDKLVTIALKWEFPEEEPLRIEAVNNTEEIMKPVEVTEDM